LLLEVLVNLVHEIFGDEIVVLLFDIPSVEGSNGEILGHVSLLNSLNSHVFEEVSELGEEFVVVKLSSVSETSGPCEDRGDGVGGGSLSLLPLSVMSGDGTVGGFRFDDSVFVQEDRGHESKRAVTLGNDVTLNVTIVVLASPDEAPAALKNLSD